MRNTRIFSTYPDSSSTILYKIKKIIRRNMTKTAHISSKMLQYIMSRIINK